MNRQELLQALESVLPGLGGEDAEGLTHFAFRNGRVWTCDDEIACSHELDLGFEGSVPSEPLLGVLRKVRHDVLEVGRKNGELILSAKGEQAGIRLDEEIVLPLDSLEKPAKWKSLPQGWAEAVRIVVQCADARSSTLSAYIHVHPQRLEACDEYQLCRHELETPLPAPVLVKASALKHSAELGMTKFAETEAWVHFRNQTGLTLSCRRYADAGDYPNLDSALVVKGGKPATLPRTILEAVDKAEIFTADNQDADRIRVELKDGRLKLRGEGSLGWYTKVAKAKYSGPPLAFLVGPKMLRDVVERSPDVLVSKERIKVEGPGWVFVSCLFQESGVGSEKEE